MQTKERLIKIISKTPSSTPLNNSFLISSSDLSPLKKASIIPKYVKKVVKGAIISLKRREKTKQPIPNKITKRLPTTL